MECLYCNSPSKVECLQCETILCNNKSGSFSHIVYHLTKSRHNTIAVDGIPIACNKCASTNIFDITVKEEIFLCRQCCPGSFEPVIQERILSFLPSVTVQDKVRATCDEGFKVFTKNQYNSFKEYSEVYSTLVKAECEEEKSLKESLNSHRLTVKYNSNFALFYHPSECRITIGDEFILSTPRIRIQGYVVGNQTEEVRLKISKQSRKEILNASDPHEFISDVFSVEYVYKSVGRNRMLSAIKHIKKKCSQELSNVILTGVYETVAPGECPETIPNLPTLNLSQRAPLASALTNALTLIQGPPGTGKTVLSAVIVNSLVYKGRILVCASSNTAIDNLTMQIHKAGLRVVRVYSRKREIISSNIEFLALHTQVETLKKSKPSMSVEQLERTILRAAQVVACTCVTAGRLSGSFPIVLIDEAVQCIEPQSLIPLCFGCEKLILVGDHRQLGPVILDRACEKAGLKLTLFERLVNCGVMPFLLKVQYRMHPLLSEFVCNVFYGGEIENCYAVRNLSLMDILPLPTFFYVVYGREELSKSGTSFLNPAEAQFIEKLVKFMVANGVKPAQIGVITPYEGQRDALGGIGVEVSNVDAFQGREKDYILLSMVRSNLSQGIGFVGDHRRLNVMLTRAKHGLIIVGNPLTLKKNKYYDDLINFYEERGWVFDGPITELRRSYVVKKKLFDLRTLADDIFSDE